MYKYVVVLILAICAQKAFSQQKVKVSVYYESLCPDSIKFFTKQLYPTLQRNLSQYIDLQLIPFGKATQTFNQQQGAWEFQCHHGPNECYGNKVQACAITRVNNPQPSELGYNKVQVAFINCLMDKVEKSPYRLPISDCASLNNVPNLVEIENCANHTEGATLLSNLGHITDKLQPKLNSVPTIVFNNAYNKEDNELAQANFPKALCGYIPDNKPAECQKNDAHIPTINVMIVMVTTLTTIALTHFF